MPKKPSDFQLALSWNADTLDEHVSFVDVPGAAPDSGDAVPPVLATDAPPPPEPETLSEKTRVCVVDADSVAPTVMAHGMGDAKMGQTFVDTKPMVVERVYGVDICRDAATQPSPTITANGLGGRSNRGAKDSQMIVQAPVNTPDRTPLSSLAPALPTDQPPSAVAETLSPNTFVATVRTDRPAPTVQTNASLGDAKQYAIAHVAQAPESKPPYRVPLMSEIRDLPWNGLNVVSTFSGCGGSCLGFKMAGYRVLWANEFVPAAQETYRANHAGTILSTQDIRTVTGAQIRDAIGDVEIDVLEGSPPCASFSTAGKTSKGWGQVRKYCVDPDTRCLTETLEWVRAEDVSVGQRLLGFDEHGAKSRGRKFRTATVQALEKIRRPSVRMTFADGTVVTCSVDHRWLVGAARRREKKRFRSQQWQRAADLRVGDEVLTIGRPWIEDQSKDAGWLAGMFDGEGCVSATKTSGGISVAQRTGPTLDRLKSLLAIRRFEVGVSDWSDGSGQSVTVNGGLPERLRFLGVIRPPRLLAQAHKLWDGVLVGACDRTKIVAMEDVGDREVVAVSTDAKTFIAEGLLSHNSDVEQRTDDLFEQYIRLVDELRPRAFVAENVSGMVKGVAKGFFLRYLRKMKALPYNVEARLLDAQWLGVPQARVRLIFVGVRQDVGRPAFPKKLPYRYSVRDALPWIGRVEGGHGFDGHAYRDSDAPAETITQSRALKVETRKVGSNDVVADYVAPTLDGYAIGDELEQVASATAALKEAACSKGLPSSAENNTAADPRFFNLVRPKIDAPCPTITQTGGNVGAASVVHPTERRKFTIAELRRICGFPDDFVLTGTYGQQWERMGRAVPPPMMAAVAAALAPVLKKDRD